MNPIFSRTFKALCTIAVVGLLSACGASSTVDPFTPTRVIGLGDARNDTNATQYTIRGTGEVSTVVGQVAALFGVSTVQSSVTTGDETVADLITQVNNLGQLQSTDLIVITTGAADFAARGGVGAANANAAATAYLNSLKTALDTLKSKGATHILLTTVVDTAVSIDDDVVNFNLTVSAGLGSYANVARLANIDRPAAFSPWSTSGATPYCTNASALVGCNLGETTATADISTFFLADTINPTPAGNRWIAQYLYNVTAQGWR